jgi:hypothetical protein
LSSSRAHLAATLEVSGKNDEGEIMKRTAKIAAVVSGAAIAAGAFAVPALASGPGPASASLTAQQVTDRQGPGNGNGTGNGMQLRVHDRDGTCVRLPASGTLTASQRAELVSAAQDEKLAHDLYAQFYQAYHLRVFSNLGAAEASHLQALRTLMARYGIADPTAGQAAGHFSTPAAQAAYGRLLAQGQTSQQAALTVTRNLERDAITRCTAALNGVTAPDARQVMQNLKAAETRHLAAVGNWITQ